MTESERCSEGRVAFRSLVIIVGACFAMLVGPAFGAGGARAGVVPTALPGAPAFPDALRSSLEEALQSRAKGFAARTRHLRPDGTPEYTNRLVLEKSPYLQQHAHNPVNWYPWGEQAFAAARRLGRPVLVSIGYSTCHWCHVMEEESFDSVETARELNSHFIAIKVDREARPDVDAIYMSAIHAMGQRGGWPLNLWLTPDGEPFFGGTYFPKQDRGGRRGFVSVLESIHRAYSDDRERIHSGASQLAARIKQQLEGHVAVASVRFGGPILERVLAHYDRAADREWGGVGSGTKFPSSLPIGLLLREARRTQNPKTLDPALLTLDKMARGGIHDHLAGGFHRYSTERRWLIPHFEKMLYDNALLAVSYLEAFQATGNYVEIVRDILDYVSMEMTSPEGGFYSAADADSLRPDGEAEEGYYFTWTLAEVEAVLGVSAARIPIAWYGIVARGPHDGRNVLHTWRTRSELARELGISTAVFDRDLALAREKLLEARGLRMAPLRDDKILVAWNGLMISAFARAGFVLAEERYLEIARRAASFVLTSMRREGRLHRVSLFGQAAGPAFLEDYAFLIAALIDLYEATADPRWIETALSLQETLDDHYLDVKGGGYFKTADDGERLLAREKPIRDGAIPSGNSVAAANLSRLAALTGNELYLERLGLLYSSFESTLAQNPATAAQLMQTISDREAGIREVVLIEAEAGAGLEAMLEPLRSQFVPNRVLIRTREGQSLSALADTLPVVRERKAIGGKTTAYVCENRVCQFPTNEPEVFRRLLAQLLRPTLPDSSKAE